MTDSKPMTPDEIEAARHTADNPRYPAMVRFLLRRLISTVDALRSENAAMREVLRDWLKWADGWCPTERCCASTCKAVAERTAALLKQEPTQ